ncbi:MAG: hypothetical protein BroJett011_73230 [Chloroflexota bacterium]|nr:MAG: hypothetical protein BroJett011_73230 [Chloroflexota bacterium]
MTATTPSDLVITPATWPSQKAKLEKTPTHLLNLVGWYGSTHAAAMWRKAAEFLAIFRQTGMPGFDPQIEGWDPAYAAVEAEVLADAAVIIIRLENHELVNGSLGSIAEVGLALTSAALRGQVVIVSIEDNLLASLNDPGAVAQYMILEMFMEEIDSNPIFSRFLQLHRGDDLAELAHLACIAARQQMEAAHAGLDFNDYLAKKSQRQQNYPLRVLVGGSGGPYVEDYQDSFQKKIKRLAAPYTGEGYALSILSEGAVAEAWDIPYHSPNPLATGLAMRTLLSIELESKKGADKLLLPIVAEAGSKAAATEIGFLLLFALTTGQDISIFLEPFDPLDFIRHYLHQVEIKANADEKSMRATLDDAGVPHAVLTAAAQAEVAETCTLIQALRRGETATFKQIKQSLLGRTEAFQAADNARRVRVLVQAHLEKLHADPRYPNFFSYSTHI